MPKILSLLRLVERVKCRQCSGRGYYPQRLLLPNTYGRMAIIPAECPKCLRKGSVIVTKPNLAVRIGLWALLIVTVLLFAAMAIGATILIAMTGAPLAAVAGTGLLAFFAVLFASLDIKKSFNILIGNTKC